MQTFRTTLKHLALIAMFHYFYTGRLKAVDNDGDDDGDSDDCDA